MAEKEIMNSLNELLKVLNLDKITEESTGFDELPDGYYLSEVTAAKLTTSKSSGQPMVSFTFNVVEDGKQQIVDEDSGNVSTKIIPHSKNRKIFIHYILKDESTVKRFVADMLKFEGDKPGESLLSKDYFSSTELIEQAIDVLTGSRIWINVSTSVSKDGNKSTWSNPISWKRAGVLEL